MTPKNHTFLHYIYILTIFGYADFYVSVMGDIILKNHTFGHIRIHMNNLGIR